QDIAKPLAEWWNWMDLIVRLKHVKHVDGVLGAIQAPGGMGESLLRWLTPRDDADKHAHEHSLAVLDAVRGLDPSPQFLATSLLQYVQNHPMKAAKQPKNKPAKPPQAPPPPTKRILAITAGSNLSEYFFS
ncbi:MAG: hypothetical protein L0099_15060, partial [Acidobacteria bacterium]|nr:hypothetical protein [Acidobacteriota bacterium]